MATGEHENGDQADGGPGAATLDDGQDVRPRLGSGACDSEHADDGDEPEDVVDRANNGWLRSSGQVTSNPAADLLGSLWAVQKILAAAGQDSGVIDVVTYPLVKS